MEGKRETKNKQRKKGKLENIHIKEKETEKEKKRSLSSKTNKVDCKQDSMQQAAWVPNATGNTATPTVTSWPYPGGSGFHTAIIATLPPGTTRNGKETGNMGREKHVARTKPSKTKQKQKIKLN